MSSTLEQFEPATYKYVRQAADQLPFFAEEVARRQLNQFLVTYPPLSDLGPDFVEFFGKDLARSLAEKIKSLAEEDLSSGRIARAAIRWVDRLNRRLDEGDFPRFGSTSSVSPYPEFTGTTRTQLPDGTTIIEYHYK